MENQKTDLKGEKMKVNSSQHQLQLFHILPLALIVGSINCLQSSVHNTNIPHI